MNGSRFVYSESDELRQRFKNAIKRVSLAFLVFWFIVYLSIIVALVSGHIDLSKIIAQKTVEIYPPFFSYILSGFIALRALTVREADKITNQVFLLFVILIVVEMLVIYAFLGYWIHTNIGTIKAFRVLFTPWNVSVEVVK